MVLRWVEVVVDRAVPVGAVSEELVVLGPYPTKSRTPETLCIEVPVVVIAVVPDERITWPAEPDMESAVPEKSGLRSAPP